MKKIVYHPVFLSVLSAVLLILSYPRWDALALIWVALVPLLAALDMSRSRRASFGHAYLTGVLFFAGTLYWFVHVTWLGAVLLILYLAVYFGLFGLVYAFSRRLPLTLRIFFNAGGWCLLEFARARLFSGFDWVSLGHSQHRILPLIQIADITGVFGVSFVVVAVNVLIRELAARRPENLKGVTPSAVCVCLLILAAAGYGFWKTGSGEDRGGPGLEIALVQPNIPQWEKLTRSRWPGNFEKQIDLTLRAASLDPDLIIWPETALPGFLWEERVFLDELAALVETIGIPVMTGAVVGEDQKYYNSTLLIQGRGRPSRYDKIHLVPFGKYVPFRRWIPKWVYELPSAELLGMMLDFSPGRSRHIFELERGGRVFRLASIICFEDTVAGLTRRFAAGGAGILVNITNDAWFLETKAPFLHLQSAVFRSVENRRPLVVAANTGLSCFVSPSGRVRACVEDGSGKKIFVPGILTRRVEDRDDITFYTRFGDVFVLACGLLFITGLGLGFRARAA